MIQNPGEALSAAWDAIVESWNTQVINEDAKVAGNFSDAFLEKLPFAVVGTKGVDKAVKAAKGTKLVQEAANGYKVIKSDVANKVGNMKVPVRVRQEVLATPDGRKFSMWNVKTKPARELYQKFSTKGTVKSKQIDFTRGFDVEPKYSSYEQRIKTTPVNKGEWSNERAESLFISDKTGGVKKYLDEAGVDGVEYKN